MLRIIRETAEHTMPIGFPVIGGLPGQEEEGRDRRNDVCQWHDIISGTSLEVMPPPWHDALESKLYGFTMHFLGGTLEHYTNVLMSLLDLQ